MPGAGPALRAPQRPGSRASLPAFTCRAATWHCAQPSRAAPARGLRGGGVGGSGASSGSAPAGLCVALPAALAAAGVGGRAAGAGAAGGARRGGASTLLFPQPRPKPTPCRPARPAWPRRWPPSPGPTLRHLHSHTHPGQGQLARSQSPSRTLCPWGPYPQGLPSSRDTDLAAERESMGFPGRGRGTVGVVAINEQSRKVYANGDLG